MDNWQHFCLVYNILYRPKVDCFFSYLISLFCWELLVFTWPFTFYREWRRKPKYVKYAGKRKK